MNNTRPMFYTARQMKQMREKRRQQEIADKATLVIEGFAAGVILTVLLLGVIL